MHIAIKRLGASTAALLASALLAALPTTRARAATAIYDDFSSGTDAAWTHVDPLAQFGAAGSFDASNHNYRLQAAPSPAPAATGAARIASLRADQTYSDFRLSVDITSWYPTDQAMGLLARITNPGLGTTDGYAFTYSFTAHDIDINRITGEAPAQLGRLQVDPTLNYTDPVRLVFTGNGPTLTGQIFKLTDLSTPIGTVTATDATYASGVTGLLAFDNTDTATGSLGTDVTFDNYSAVPEPTGAAVAIGIGTLLLRRRRQRT